LNAIEGVRKKENDNESIVAKRQGKTSFSEKTQNSEHRKSNKTQSTIPKTQT
jgi:hypothetical protein